MGYLNCEKKKTKKKHNLGLNETTITQKKNNSYCSKMWAKNIPEMNTPRTGLEKWPKCEWLLLRTI